MSTDVTGFSSLARNILFGWATQFIVLIIGFLVPRLISDNLGQEMLGIWDLGWSTIRYLSMFSLAVGPAMSRNIAYHRARDEMSHVRQMVNVGIIWQVLVATVLFVAGTILVTLYTDISSLKLDDSPLSSDQQSLMHTILWFFVAVLSVLMLNVPSGGILTGLHRWDIQYGTNGAEEIALAIMMVSVLLLGGGLVNLAQGVLGVTIFFMIIRSVLAIRALGQFKFTFKDWEFKLAKSMFMFGVKGALWYVPYAIMIQTMVFVIGAVASTAVVAVFSRGLALVRFGEQIVRRTTSIIMPIVSSLEGQDRAHENKNLVLQMALYTAIFYFPIAATLAIMGKFLLLLWMGPGYDNGIMIAALALGSLLPVSQTGSYQVLLGSNQHGRVAIKAAAVSLALLSVIIYIGYNYGISASSAAIMSGIAWTASYSIVLPLALKKLYGVSLREYCWNAFILPFMACSPFTLSLIAAHVVLAMYGISLTNLLLCAFIITAGGLTMLYVYWRYVFNDAVCKAVVDKIPFLKRFTLKGTS